MNSKIKTKFLSMVILIVLFSGTSFSQDNVIHKLTERDESAKKGNVVGQRSSAVITEFPNDLLYELKSTIYIKNNGILNVEGPGAPLVLKFLDVKSFNFTSTRNPLYNKVEMITISLSSENDLRNTFDLNTVKGFSHLKYIYLKCEFPISENQVRSFIQNADPEITFFYNTYRRS